MSKKKGKFSRKAQDWLQKHLLKPNAAEMKKVWGMVQVTGTGAYKIEPSADGLPRVRAVDTLGTMVTGTPIDWGRAGKMFKRSKYGARKVKADGHTFDSWLEFSRYQVLKELQAAGKIKGLALQRRYELQPAFKKGAKTYRAIEYVADFEYQDAEGNLVVEDTKGFKTETFKLKHKMFEYRYPHLTLRIINGRARNNNAG